MSCISFAYESTFRENSVSFSPLKSNVCYKQFVTSKCNM